MMCFSFFHEKHTYLQTPTLIFFSILFLSYLARLFYFIYLFFFLIYLFLFFIVIVCSSNVKYSYYISLPSG